MAIAESSSLREIFFSSSICSENRRSWTRIRKTVKNTYLRRLCSDDSEGEEGQGGGTTSQQRLDELDNKCFTPVEVPEGEHRLQSQYCLWYSRREDQHTENKHLIF